MKRAIRYASGVAIGLSLATLAAASSCYLFAAGWSVYRHSAAIEARPRYCAPAPILTPCPCPAPADAGLPLFGVEADKLAP